MTKSAQQTLHAMRLYLGSLQSCNQREVDKLYVKVVKLSDKLARATNTPSSSVWLSLTQAAKAAGAITPIPGKDI